MGYIGRDRGGEEACRRGLCPRSGESWDCGNGMPMVRGENLEMESAGF